MFISDEAPVQLEKISKILTFDFRETKNISSDVKEIFQKKEKKEFDERVSTYKVGLWLIPEISPLHCAQHGWHLIDSEILKCTSCKALLCTRLPSNNLRDAYRNFLKLLEEGIQTAHKDICSFRFHSSPQEFVQPSFKILDLRNLSNTVLKLCTFGQVLPLIDIKGFMDILGLNEYHLTVFFKIGEPLDDVKLTSAILTLCGWSKENSNTIRCNLCLRRIGLWQHFSLREFETHQKYIIKINKRLLKKKKEDKKLQSLSKTDSMNNFIDHQKSLKVDPAKQDSDGEIDFVELENTLEDVYEEENLLQESKSKTNPDHFKSRNGSLVNASVHVKGSEEEYNQTQSQILAIESKHGIHQEDKTKIIKPELPVIQSLDDRRQTECVLLESDISSPDDSATQDSNEDLWTEALNCNEAPPESKITISGSNSQEYDVLELQDTQNVKFATKFSLQSKHVPPLSSTSSDNQELNESQPSDIANSNNKRLRSLSNTEDESTDGENPPKRFHKDILRADEYNPACPSEVNVEAIAEDSDTSDNSNYSKDEEVRTAFDPLSEHRHWCGWLWKTNYKGKNVPGYLIIPPQLKDIIPHSSTTNLSDSMKYNENIKGLRAIRTFLEECTIPTIKQMDT